MKRAWLLTILLGLVKGCGFFKPDVFKPEAPAIEEVVMQLGPAAVQDQQLARPSVADLIVKFEAIKSASQDPAQRYEIAQRLTQLRLLEVEEQLASGHADVNFSATIMELEELRAFDKADGDAAEVTYQLARMRDLSGASAEVQSTLSDLIALGNSDAASLEARFRRAEIHFSNSDFERAADDYAYVADVEGQYQLHARYMLAWVHFKQGHLDDALDMAIAAFDQLASLPTDANDELKADLTRVTIIALDYADGAETLADLMTAAGKPEWQSMIYRALGDWYLSKSRFADSAKTWNTFLEQNPLHEAAPAIALQVIATQREAGFVDEIPDLELNFIARYGKQGEFFSVHGEPGFEQYQVALKDMLDRYSQRLHATAQSTGNESDFDASAEAYRLWLANFVDDSGAQEKRFLLAEVLQSAGQLPAALLEYRAVVALDQNAPQAREAAYAIVLGEQSLDLDREAQITANLNFARWYADDPRAPACQLHAATLLFEAGRHVQALPAAELARTFDLKPADLMTAMKVVGHSAFELEKYELAALQYRQLLAYRNDSDIRARLLASVFKQGQQAEQAGDLMFAIKLYGDLADIDGEAALSRDAQYDVAAIYESLGDKPGAINQLLRFRSRFSMHGDEVSSRLVGLYEDSGNYIAAAEELLDGKRSNEATRLARFRAAELFLKAGATDLAIEHFRFYAHNYPEPADLRFEAMHHMDLLYQQTGEDNKRHYWLRKKRDTYYALRAAEHPARIKYLAAEASFILSNRAFDEFRQVRLTQPLAKSLGKKQQRLKRAIEAYEATAEIGVFEFVTRANLQIANLYQTLAEDLLASERPTQLNALEQDQYEMLLEEQAYPFEEQAIALYQRNLQLGWRVEWDDAVNTSLVALQTLSPGRFNREAAEVQYVQP